eukprot:TRINITY_DN24017_c0_g1_i1.p1 TRINITY_DN24017_c0_g1~~TRINITY_DN24017_c0_g1_i1.p1  ORF type:complete len:304 (+),score=39.64 TRINITY_DN24017_c0_g1_i1:135-1046(+)
MSGSSSSSSAKAHASRHVQNPAVERAVSALVGYTMGAIPVLPFDRIKTLMQVSAQQGKHMSSVTVARSLFASQGVKGFYQGFGPHFMIAPYTMFYYTVYGELLAMGGGHPLAPLGAAMAARTMETTIRMPFELLRTQMQAAEGSMSMWECVKMHRSQPLSDWFRGFVPTLLRDVPFSAIYWLAYETSMSKSSCAFPEDWVPNAGLRTFLQAYTCGAGAGMIAALATTPSDVIKTIRQHQLEAGKSPTYGQIVLELRHNPRTAFAGVGPRLIRLPLGLSTMMSGLEVTKWFFESRRIRAREDSS